ncbi:MAG: ankyrin repeat domain-containing protein [Steroidobacteraceae bacterium]
MSRRSVTILVVLAAMTFAAAFYAKERRSRLPVHVPLVSRTAANTGRERKAVNMAVAADVSSPARKRFSQREYDLLWQRYKPNSGLADGPLSADRLDNLATIVKNDTRDKKMWPVFRDVIYGNSAALENRLDTGLSADATIHLDYPYNASVSLLDMAIRAGQRDIIRELLRHNSSVGPLTEVAPDGTPLKVEAPLPLAAADGEDDVVRLLLQSGADIEQGRALRSNNQTALDAAVTMQDVSTAYLLLSHGADVNSALDPGGTVPSILIPPQDAPPRMIALRDLLMEYGAKMPAGQ